MRTSIDEIKSRIQQEICKIVDSELERNAMADKLTSLFMALLTKAGSDISSTLSNQFVDILSNMGISFE